MNCDTENIESQNHNVTKSETQLRQQQVYAHCSLDYHICAQLIRCWWRYKEHNVDKTVFRKNANKEAVVNDEVNTVRTMVSGMPRSGLSARDLLATIVRMSEITQSINYGEAKPDSSKSSNNKHELILNVSDTKQTKTSDVYLEARCAANSQSGIRISRPGLHKLKAYSVCTRRSGVTSYKLCLVWKFGETLQ